MRNPRKKYYEMFPNLKGHEKEFYEIRKGTSTKYLHLSKVPSHWYNNQPIAKLKDALAELEVEVFNKFGYDIILRSVVPTLKEGLYWYFGRADTHEFIAIAKENNVTIDRNHCLLWAKYNRNNADIEMVMKYKRYKYNREAITDYIKIRAKTHPKYIYFNDVVKETFKNDRSINAHRTHIERIMEKHKIKAEFVYNRMAIKVEDRDKIRKTLNPIRKNNEGKG